MKVFGVVTLVLLCFAFRGELAAQPAGRSAESAPDPRLKLDEQRFAFEQLKAKEDRDFEKEKLAQNHALEREKLNHRLEWWKALVPAGSIVVTLLLGLIAYVYQGWTRRKDEKLQFQLKVAEIVMNSRDANQAEQKAEFLAALFPERLTKFEPSKEDEQRPKTKRQLPYFGKDVETREELLRLLVQHPESRSEIMQAWEILFPWHSAKSESAKKWIGNKTAYKWFDELRNNPSFSQNKPPPAGTADPQSRA